MTRWFGEPWPDDGPPYAAVCQDETYRVPTPVGQPCLYCPEPIKDGDRGIVVRQLNPGPSLSGAMHIDCLIRVVVGSQAIQDVANEVRAKEGLSPLEPPNAITGYQPRGSTTLPPPRSSE